MPYGITAAPDGTLWFTENGTTPHVGQLSTAGAGSVLRRVCPARGYQLPKGSPPGPTATSGSSAMAPAWSARSRRAGSITTYSLERRQPAGADHHRLRRQPLGDRGRRQPDRAGHDRRLDHRVRRPHQSAMPWGITPGPDGNLWFTENGAGKIGRITTGGVITEFSLGSPALVSLRHRHRPRRQPLVHREHGQRPGPDHDRRERSPSTRCRPVSRARRASPSGPGTTSIWWTESTAGQVGKLPWLAQGQTITPDPTQTQYNDFATGTNQPVRRQTSRRDLHWTRHCRATALRRTAGHRACASSSLSLTYNSDTVGVRPIIADDLSQRPQRSGPDPDPGHAHLERHGPARRDLPDDRPQPGDVYLLSTQVATPVTTTGVYPWSVAIQATLAGRHHHRQLDQRDGRRGGQRLDRPDRPGLERRRHRAAGLQTAMGAFSGSTATAAAASSRPATAPPSSARPTTSARWSRTVTARSPTPTRSR